LFAFNNNRHINENIYPVLFELTFSLNPEKIKIKHYDKKLLINLVMHLIFEYVISIFRDQEKNIYHYCILT